MATDIPKLPNLRNQTIGVRSFLRLNPYSKLTLQYHGINEFRRGGNLLKLPAHEANIAEQIEHNINGGGLSYDYFSPDEKNHLNVYFSFQNTARKVTMAAPEKALPRRIRRMRKSLRHHQ